MIPVKKSWTNIVMGEDQDHVIPCPAYKDKSGDVTVAWELTDEEVEAIVKTKTILSKHYTYNYPMQPVQLWIEDATGNAIKDDRV
ncbi:MAG TPA: hypothetical protein VIQ51_04775 [Chryseosolibacter sp.]|jgi:hypothetical protein